MSLWLVCVFLVFLQCFCSCLTFQHDFSLYCTHCNNLHTLCLSMSMVWDDLFLSFTLYISRVKSLLSNLQPLHKMWVRAEPIMANSWVHCIVWTCHFCSCPVKLPSHYCCQIQSQSSLISHLQAWFLLGKGIWLEVCFTGVVLHKQRMWNKSLNTKVGGERRCTLDWPWSM